MQGLCNSTLAQRITFISSKLQNPLRGATRIYHKLPRIFHKFIMKKKLMINS